MTETQVIETVMIVDDTPENLRLLDAMLREHGYRVLTLPRGDLALRAAEKIPPDLILLDVSMPEMSGYEVCRRLKADPRMARIPVVFISALSEIGDKVEAFRAGGVDYITKPFQLEEVVARVGAQLSILRLQRSVEQRNQELTFLNEQKNYLLGVAAHDLRNPLAIVSGYLDMLGLIGPLTEQQAEIAKRIAKAVRFTVTMLNDLLDVSKIEAGRLDLEQRATDLGALARDRVVFNQLLGEQKAITIDVETDEGLPPVEVDPDRIAQVLDNLLTNAIKFSRTGARVKVEVRRDGESVLVVVIDQGQGIPKSELPRLFEPFGRTSAKPTGGERSTGLGLAISQKVVRAHGGIIEIASQLGIGTQATVRLPLVRDPPVSP
jgi:two-component system sensor histidine kinase/response regulator